MKIKIHRAIDKNKIPWRLLLDADPSRMEINKYLKRGELWLATSSKNVLGAMVLLQTRADVLEIMNVAVDPKFQGKRIGTQLLKMAKVRAKQLKMSRLHVGTGNSSLRQLAFYQRFGFRIIGVDVDFFISRYPKIYKSNGVSLLDMIRMEIRV